MAVEYIVVVVEQHEKVVPERAVFFRQDVGQVEVGVDDSALAHQIPVDGNGRLHALAPFVINAGEIVLVDANFGLAAFPDDEVVLDEMLQFLLVIGKTVDDGTSFQCVADEAVDLPEFFRGVVGRCDVPIEVVLIEHVKDGVVGQQPDFRHRRLQEKRVAGGCRMCGRVRW